MAWTERQHAMLRELGLRLWSDPIRLPPMPAPGAASEAVAGPVTAAPAAGRGRPAESPAAAAQGGAGADDRVRRIASLGWAELRADVASCRACGLCETRRQTVFGVGSEHAHWMVVGEAPGEQEDLQGEPFVGAAGELLDDMLAALGLTREAGGERTDRRRVYIANTLKCRPPRNRNPEPAEMARCEPFLMRQLALLQPRLILAMGRFAVQALLRSSEPVGRLRGRVHTYQGVPLIVTYHPAYLLRNLPDKARAWEDLCLAASVAERAPPGPGSPARPPPGIE